MPRFADSFDEIVAWYRDEHQEKSSRELRLFSTRKTLESAVRLAALARTPAGKKLRHQWRIPNRLLAKSAGILLADLQALSRAVTFEELYEQVEAAVAVTSHRLARIRPRTCSSTWSVGFQVIPNFRVS